jgi:Flavodoxin domain
MKAIVVYESVFGNTRTIAAAIARGLSGPLEVTVVRAGEADPSVLNGNDFVVVGGPTHAWGLPRPSTRRGAPDYATKGGRALELEPDAATQTGLREWLAALGHSEMKAAAFDTRIKGPQALTGRASRSISRALSRHGMTLVVPAQSFLVDKKNRLLAGEIGRAEAWGASLAQVLGASTVVA